ncbi:hypothetical protein U879_15935 [Defluviimonas sp. 20V17]|uniref:Flagellar basal body-associated protein FliL n=1 Tax=Allgaiera indica TaxID=765699 RepID=A0AAN4UR36_9RHOB|nr:flagellar basal body-associated FliL family protein [Allgaiera indica]KDB02683.1 hypothetical protein U879_15935 [Defluviimonas sp. 20V17]GHE01794.1 flagellar basal body-associated protein FliL [Allgaiera indica]SDW92911.1 hypothetical protein SAMN05444006_10847 [Allgaiera indica]
MLSMLFPVVFLLVGLGAGAGAGVFLRPPAEAPAETAAAGSGAAPAGGHGDAAKGKGHDGKGEAAKADDGQGEGTEDSGSHDFVKLNNQFIVPVLEHGRVSSLVIMSLSLEVSVGGRDRVFALEPKLRDALLRVMFDHANSGGFDGNFTSGNNMLVLRDALKEAAFKTLGPILKNVLIIDMLRQDA